MKNKNFLEDILYSITILFISITVILVICSHFGIRVICAPDLLINWDATSTIVETIGVILVPFMVIYVQHKWDENKQDIAVSNMVTIKELEEFKQQYEQILHDLTSGTLVLDGGSAAGFGEKTYREKVIQYLGVSMGATKNQISEQLNLSLASVTRILNQLLSEGIIQSTPYRRNRIYKLSK